MIAPGHEVAYRLGCTCLACYDESAGRVLKHYRSSKDLWSWAGKVLACALDAENKATGDTPFGRPLAFWNREARVANKLAIRATRAENGIMSPHAFVDWHSIGS